MEQGVSEVEEKVVGETLMSWHRWANGFLSGHSVGIVKRGKSRWRVVGGSERRKWWLYRVFRK